MKNLFLTKTRWLVTIILLTALGSGNVWGADVDSGSTPSFTETSGSLDTYISYAAAKAGGTTAPVISSNKIRIYRKSKNTAGLGGTLTVTAIGGAKITSITITKSSINATSVTLQNNSTSQMDVTRIQVTYNTAAPEYTITATRNNDSYGTVEVSGTTITATPAAGYRVIAGNDGYTVTSGSATVVNNGDNTFTVTPSSDCTVRINFESKGCTDHGASSITGGALSDADHGPLHAYYDYSTSQILYTKSDLALAAGKKGTIKSIYFEYSGDAAMAARTIKIYMANTDLSSLTTSNYVPYASFTQVYSGTFSCGSAGWYEITLDTPFDYNGAGQLAVMIDDNTNTYESSKSFKYHSATGKQIYKRQDDTDIDPASWTPASAIDYRPNTKFCIQEADMTPATVTLMDNGATITEASAGAGVTLPSRAGCAGYTFAGWTKTWVTDQTEWTTTAPTIIPAGSYTPTANENLYPVYTKTEDGGGGSTTESYGWETSDDATNWTISGIEQGSTYKKTGSNSGKIARGSAGESTITFKDKVNVTSFSFQFLRQTTNNNYNVRIETSTDGSSWDEVENYNMSAFSSKETWYAKSHSFDGKTALYVRFVCYTSTAVRWVDDISITYAGAGGSTTSYISVPNCCTPLGSINGSINVNNATSVTLQWDAVEGAEKYQVKVPGSSSHDNWTDVNSTSVTVTKSCGTAYTAHFRAIDTNGSHCAEGPESTLDIPAVSWTVSSTISDGTALPAIPGTTCNGFSTTISPESGYALPAEVAVTNADKTWNSSTGELTISNVTGNVTITVTCAAESCSGQYTFDYGGTKQCFSRVGETDEFQITGYTIPTTTTNYWVGYNGYFYNDNLGTGNPKAKSANNLFKYMPVANLQGSPCGGTGEYYKHAAAGAYGTLRIYQNSSADNLYVGFSPAGYQMRIGSGDSWTNVQLTQDGSTWTSDLVTLDAATIAKNYYINVWTGASYSSSDEGVAINNWTDGGSTISSMVFKTGALTWNTESGLSAGMRGKFRTWTDNCANNGYCHFVPYYRVTYDGNGASGSVAPSADVSCEGNDAARTVQAAANGFTVPTGKTFGGWATSAENAAAGTVAYAAGADVVLTQSIVLYAIWTDINYTVTLTQTPAAGAKLTGGTTTAHYGGTINISTDEPSGYRFNGWTSSPSVTFADASATSTSFTMPDGNVTVTANFVQTHTVTWKVSGSADNEVVYDHGDALVLPSNPSAPTACSEKRFVGWKEGAIDGSTDDRPTMLNPSSPGTVTADKTYYAVFADEGTTFTKVTDPSVFVAGDKIAIVSNDNSYGLRISSNAPAATANTISDAATITPAADQVFTLAGNSTDGFTMSTASRTSEGTVTLGAASVPNNNRSENVILISSNNTWKFSAHNTSNCILISPSSKSTCGLEYYNSSWKIYNNSGVASNAACAMRVYRKNLSGYVTTCSECMTPSDLEVSAITSTGATVTWAGVSQTQQAGGSGTGYKVAWNTSNSVPSPLNASNSADVAAGTNTYDITGLTAATQYYVFVQSKCDDSWSSSTNFYTNAKITYAAGEGSGSMDPKEVTYNTDATVDACTFTAPSGKKFNGWVSDQSVMVSASSTTSVPEGATVTGLTKAITLTAQWRDLASYTVNFSADNGTVAGGTAQTVYEEGKLTFPNVTSTTCGTFIGWVEAAYDNTAAPSGATFHAAGSQIDVVAELEGKTYYAVYRVATGMATTLTDNLVPSDFKATGTSYEATNNLVKTSSATYEAVTAKGNNAIQINKISDGRGIVSKISGGIFKGITLTTNANHSASRKVYVYGSSSYTAAYADPAAFNTNSEVRRTLLATLAGDTKTYSTSTDDYEYIAIFADGAAYLDQISLTWYGAPMKYQTSPTCSPMVGVESNFSTFTYAYNAGPSASQSFTVSGSSLGADLVVTAPANYEICKTADGTYTSTISYTPSDGAVANTTAYIRLAAGLNVGTYNYAAASGLQVTSTGAKTRTAALNGSVTKADCAITFTDFNAVDHYEATLEYGSRVTVSYNYTYNGDGNFSISRSPATGTIDKANKTLTVSTAGIWTLNASATAGTNYSKPSDASAQIRVKCVDTYKDFIHNKTIKAYGSGTAVTDGKMEDWGSGYTVPYIDDNAEETSGSCQQTHYKFMGWVSEDDINIADGTFKTGWTLIQAGTESKLATTKTYYAVWAKLEE